MAPARVIPLALILNNQYYFPYTLDALDPAEDRRMNLYLREKHIPGWTDIPQQDRWYLRQEAQNIGWRRPHTWVLWLLVLYHIIVGIPYVSPILDASPGRILLPVLIVVAGRLMHLDNLARAVRKYLEPGGTGV
ncbi:MAG: hypothetical protein HY962_11580 [Ignavibacteriae bacterium]|nr:hypothetical protein [Ignavibacteriota bacterium]